ncbi:MAG TPA: glycosyltransferase, partial [Gaiellaceae bacterium]|nr:glycosyltransferase [Gaiellaceae bacterium]
PSALYLVIGQTHPELLRHQGETYRNSLIDVAREIGVSDQLRFVNEYLTQREIVDYLLATDVYITPYLDPGQITSGTLAYALGAGKAIVSTPYLHASEVLADGRGLLVPFREPHAIASAVSDILQNPLLKRSLEHRAYAYGRATTWPAIGAEVLSLMRLVGSHGEEFTPREHTTPRPALIA